MKKTLQDNLDFSDYGRAPAIWIATQLKNTSISPHSITFAHSILIVIAIAIIVIGNPLPKKTLIILLPIKSILDAVDGSLAMIRKEPSVLGRYLDTILDTITTLGLFITIGITNNYSLIEIVILCFSIMLQASYWNYNKITYSKGTFQRFSITDERKRIISEEEKTVTVKFLKKIYEIILSWQDDLYRTIDRKKENPSKFFLTITTLFGTGTTLLVVGILAFFGKESYSFAAFSLLGNVILLSCIGYKTIINLLANRKS